MDKRFEELKKLLFNLGYAFIEEFIGYSISVYGMSKTKIEELINEAYKQMPEEELEMFYEKYSIK